RVVTSRKNVAGVDLPLFERTEFGLAEYDLFLTPPWVDRALVELREIVSLLQEERVVGEGIAILSQELRITTQRVNLFEKVKIPEAKEAIRLIKIHLGDQMTNAVGRSKIAKKKIEESNAQAAAE
ncbi:MAG: V-type ATP synthase subunit D, partial [Methanolinea sp.]